MEPSERNLVPEWYKGTTSSAVGNSNLNNLSRSSHSEDEHNGVSSSRKRLSLSFCDLDSPRSLSSSDRTSLSFGVSSSSNGYMVKEKDITTPAYIGFGRGHYERDWDRDASRDKNLELCKRDRSLYLVDELSEYPSMVSKPEKDLSWLTPSSVSGRVDSWVRRNGHDSSNGSVSRGFNITGISKSSFNRDFPSLGNEERHLAVDVSRVSSSELSTAIHSFPVNASATTGTDAWTSGLAEVPPIVGGNGPVASFGVQANLLPSTASSTSSVLNMAETLSQVPARMQTGAQVPNEFQKIEELHRQQILKLRPVTPSMLKNSVLNSVDKTKTKGTRASELAASKAGQQSSHPAINNILRPAQRTEVFKPLQPGNLQVLSREKNVFSPTGTNIPSPMNTFRVQSNSTAIPHSPKATPSPKLKVDGRNACLAPSSPFSEKSSQAQNRNDFFNALRRKSHANQPTNKGDPIYVVSSSSPGVPEQLGVSSTMKGEEITLSNISLIENGICSAEICEAEKLAPDEKEAAFLRSLGWEENAGEEALTREEIESFLSEYKNLKPALNRKI